VFFRTQYITASFLADLTYVTIKLMVYTSVCPSVTDVLWLNGKL